MDKLFVRNLFLYSALGLAFIGFFNYAIDPYGIRSLTKINKINDRREIIGRQPIALALMKYRPKAIALGTSRAALGFDIETLKKYSEETSVYNAGFAGADFDEIYAYFQHALYLQPDLKSVVLGIDLFSFHKKREAQPDFDEDLLFREDWPIKNWKNLFLSGKAFYTSCDCFMMSLFGIERENSIMKLGEKNYLSRIVSDERSYKEYEIGEEKINKFKELVNICKERSIDLKVYLSPLKAMYWEAYWDNGLWSKLDSLKRKLCEIYPLWDFSGFNPITMETLNSDGAQLYYDCSHFTPFVGDLLLKRMHGQASCIDSIGYLLTPDTLEETLVNISAKIRETKEIYSIKH